MDRTTELALIDEIGGLLADGTTSMAAQVARVHPDELLGSAQAATERDVLFSERPLVLAPSSAVSKVGDFVTEEIAGLPLLAVRGRDGVVRVFLNVCRHRGNRLCFEKAGNRKAAFSCSYHAWTYGLDGRCRGFVDRAGFDTLSTADFGLREFPSQERHGLIWFSPRQGGDVDVASCLGAELDTELAGFASHTGHLFESDRQRFPFNWKLGVNTFQELFHLAFLHKESLGRAFISNVSAFRSYPPHQRLTVVRSTFPEMLTEPVEKRSLFPHCTLVYVLFPNTVFVWQLDHLELWRFTPRPDDLGACDVRLWLLTEEEPTTDGARGHWQRNWDKTLETVYGEDFETMAQIQRNLTGGALDEIVYGRNEIGLQDYYRQVRAATERSAAMVGGRA
ncbi:aromatic ring-hydroxylating oxygenase subunit alpha [Pseudonocardia endophytica]|uniref:Phenylpropionate dioxygenase-like ring-hydroxylating dioxygenase large terminal subunit n=1 Tax=Pseudonocardia endophytica TaxID=401976 RepID=A0A4R1HIM9_PSEEN|nr:aromatic ring-hydroxylating dioxygenase subunit alpha [Pseudonocardia endophytica]TCK22107.1 phenylpropionate dioxygenase-like ring-hydroxylating dioxygenase large terminal subunit [Pseudonocardia endophytica]